MVFYCCVFGCKSLQGRDDVSFHTFPKDKQLKNEWEVKLGMKYGSTRSSRVCSAHFLKTDYRTLEGYKYQRKYLKRGAIPSQNLPVLPKQSFDTETSKTFKQLCIRLNRHKKRNKVSIESNNLDNSLAKPANDINEKSVIPSELYISETKIKQEKDEEILPNNKQVVPVVEALSVDERKRNLSPIEEYYEAKLEILNKEYNGKLHAMKAEYEQKIKFLEEQHEYNIAFLKLKMEYKVSKCLM